MKAKDFLGQALYIDKRINSKLEQIACLRDLATKATSTLKDNSIQSSKHVQSMEGIIIKMVSLESEINQDLETLVDLKIKIVSKIKQINNQDYQTLLELRYLCFKTWEEISSQMNYSIQNIYKIHGKALKEITVE